MMDPNEYEGPDYDDWDEWYAEQEKIRAFCDNYINHDSHAYRALNGNTYLCPGYEVDETDNVYEECHHGLSLSLCADPISHYPR